MNIQIQVYSHERWWVHTLERCDGELYWVNGTNYTDRPAEGIPILTEEMRAGRNYRDVVFPYMEGDI